VTSLAFLAYLGVRAAGRGAGLGRRLATSLSPGRDTAADARPAAPVRL
jgi:hypothetical protein